MPDYTVNPFQYITPLDTNPAKKGAEELREIKKVLLDRTYISVKDKQFAGGAKGTGDGTDDSAAFIAAINSISTALGKGKMGTLLVPEGLFDIKAVPWRDNVRIVGLSPYMGQWVNRDGTADYPYGVSVLRNNTAGQNTFNADGTTFPVINSELYGLSFIGSNAGSHISIAGSTNGCYSNKISRCSFFGKDHAIDTTGTVYMCDITENLFYKQLGVVCRFTNNSGVGGHSILLERNHFTAGGVNLEGAILFDGTAAFQNVHLLRNTITNYSAANKKAVNFNQPVVGGVIQGNWFEGNNGAGANSIFLTAYAMSIFGNRFASDRLPLYINLAASCWIGPNSSGSTAGTYSMEVRGSENSQITPQQFDKPILWASSADHQTWAANGPRYAVQGFTAAGANNITTGRYIIADNTLGNQTINLPAISDSYDGRPIHIKRITGTANTCVVTPNGGETIQGAANYPLTAQWKYVEVIPLHTDWLITGSN